MISRANLKMVFYEPIGRPYVRPFLVMISLYGTSVDQPYV